MLSRALVAALFLSTTPALAEVPRVAVDIAPVHSLVARVMEGVGTPDLILPVGSSPHGHSMRPSEAAAVERADLIVWIGPELTPWMEGALDRLSGDAVRLTLLGLDGAVRHDRREGARFEAHDHDADHADEHDHDGEDTHADEHGHDGEDTHAHAHDHESEEAHADDHDEAHDAEEHAAGGDDHAHGTIDPHAWLDPVNGQLWVAAIADALAALDPENAPAYRANAEAAQGELQVLIDEIATRLAPLSDRSFIVFHDAYQYFEDRFGLMAAGAISLSDASEPSPARVAEIRDLVADRNVACVFAEPQFNRGLVLAVFEGSGAAVGVIDPVGFGLEAGPGFYPALVRGMADSFEDCL